MRAPGTPVPTYPRRPMLDKVEQVRERYGLEQVYAMNANETPLGPSPRVVGAVRAQAGLLGLYPAKGDGRLRQALADRLGRGLEPENFFTGCSGYESLELATRAYLDSGDEVIISPPTFGVFSKITRLERARVVQVPLSRPDLGADADSILAAVSARTRMVILCNPNNPTGTITGREQVRKLVEGLPEEVLLVCDEVYHDFVRSPEYPDTLEYVLAGRSVIIIHSFSKAYGLPGLRLGYGIAPAPIADHIAGLQRGFHQSRLNLAAGVAALQDQAHRQRNIEVTLAGRDWLCQQLDRLGLDYWPSETNFILIDCARPAAEIAAGLEAYGVLVHPLGGDFENCLRVSVSVPQGNHRFISGLAEILGRPDPLGSEQPGQAQLPGAAG